MTKPPGELLEFLYRYDPAIQSLALGLRKVVLEEMAPCHEYIFEMRSKVVLVYGATERVIKDGICIIGVFAKHVNLAFQRGTDLEDRSGVLKGTGKAMRHLSLKKPLRAGPTGDTRIPSAGAEARGPQTAASANG